VHEVFRHHADDGVALVVECYRLADDVRIAAEALLPETVTDDRDWRGAGLIVGFGKVAAQLRSRTHHFEIAGRHHA
jgi:hypothetical protein